ncbi:hypothetical protein [Streptomyces sp. NPDC002209]|uniref:hypothetical protein n=1 Tax=Streptomyces sp. NPDC002209 TaxID=3364638 RepID=UPI003696F5FA
MATVSHRTRFFDHRLPSLYAGRYRIAIEQSITGLDTGAALPTRQQRFDVRQLRFSIADTDVHACYPPPGAEGAYGEVLPHITLDTPALPWFRRLKDTAEGVPWIALLLFREGELTEDDPEAVGQVKVTTVSKLLAGTDPDLPGQPPAITLDELFDDERGLSCRTIHVPAALFTAVCPKPAEMALLAHVREGGPPDAALNSDPDPEEADLNAVVVANRFPAATDGQHVAHLVSLDGFETFVNGAAPPAQGLRLVSLHSWSFQTLADSALDFGDIVQHLAADPDPLLRLPLPATSPDPEALERLRSGATALPQRLESGERSFGFYRGPFTAAPAQPLPPAAAPRLESPGEALVYLERHGVYDTGYASAFSLGRALALADAPFRGKLMEFRAAARRAARRLLTHPQLAGLGARASAALLNDNLAHRAFDRLLTADGRLMGALARSGTQLATAERRPARSAAQVAPLRSAGLRGALADAGVRGVLREATATQLDPVRAWLDRLPLLEMVPFEHLVPDARMLPPESIRFFHVDPGWIRAAVDGALSVGVGHALDADLNALAAGVQDAPESGVLIRSDLIAHWPKTVFTAFRGGAAVEPVARAVYGTDVLLLLYPRVIDTFTIAEPQQGLMFGIGDVGEGESEGTIELRKLTGPGVGSPMGDFPDPPGFDRFLRPAGDVLDITGKLAPELAAAHGLPELTPAQFALQMIKAPQLQTFVRP